MLKYYSVLLVLAYLMVGYSVKGKAPVFFRRDYTVHREVGKFYKLHRDPKPWNEARKVCAMEGATLAVPRTGSEAEIYTKMMDEQLESKAQNAYIGIQAFSKGIFTALDGTLIADIYHNWAQGEPNDLENNEDCVTIFRDTTLNDDTCTDRFPFICEKAQSDVKWNRDCQVADPDYHRLEGMDHCYKLHLKAKNWTESYATCVAEKSYLAIINSEKESNALKGLVESERGGKTTDFPIIHLGFHDRYKEGEFTTLQGMTLDEAGFNIWDDGQPDHLRSETCGSMFYNGKLNDINCWVNSFFICELENDSGLSTRIYG